MSAPTTRESTTMAYALTAYAAMDRIVQGSGVNIDYLLETEDHGGLRLGQILQSLGALMSYARSELPPEDRPWKVTRALTDAVMLELLGQTLTIGPLDLDEISTAMGTAVRGMPKHQRRYGVAVSTLAITFLSRFADEPERWMRPLLPEDGDLLAGSPAEILEQLRALLEGRPEGSTLQ